jgi:hypothetical protein
VLGTSGTTVTIPFTSADNASLAQYAAWHAVNPLPDASKFVATAGFSGSTSALGIISNVSDPTITGTAANATVIAGGGRFSYTAAGSDQDVFFSASGTGNVLTNGTGSTTTTYYIDAGGSPSFAGTTLSAPTGTAVVNDYSGYLNLNGGYFDITTVEGGAGLIATGTDTINSDFGIAVSLASGAAVTVTGYPLVDTITAAGSGTLYAAIGADAVITQTGGGDFALGTSGGGDETLNAAAGATENITYNGDEGANVVANNDTLTLLGSGPGNLTVSGSGSITNDMAVAALLTGTGALTLAGGAFAVGPVTVPSLTLTGTTDVLNSYATALGASLAASAGATVQGAPGVVPNVTIAAAAGGFLDAAQATVLINQASEGDFHLATWSGGEETLNAAAGATENIYYTGDEGANVVANNGSLGLLGSGPGSVTVSGSGTIANAMTDAASLTGTGAFTLAGGAFAVGPATVPSLTFTGTSDVLNSYATALGASLAAGAGATVQGAPGVVPNVTIAAAGAGFLDAAQATVLINQASAGDFHLASWSGGQETLNAAAGATENIWYSGAEGAAIGLSAGDNLTVYDTPVTLSGGSVVTGAVTLLGATGNVTLAGGVFFGAAGQALTAIGTADVINSYSGVTVTLADGAAATVQGAPFHVPSDTISAAGSGSLYAAQSQVVINQVTQGAFVLGSWSGGQETLNAAAGATETITYSGAEGAAIGLSAGDHLTVYDTPVTLSGGGVVTGAVTLLGATGNVTMAGGVFFAAPGQNLTAIGTADVINSYGGITLTLANGAGATVQGAPFHVPVDTVSAAGAGSLSVAAASVVATQTSAGNFVLASWSGGHATLNAFANATETITYTGAEGAYVSATGDDLTLSGNYFAVAASGSDTINASASMVALNLAAGSDVTLGSGNFSIASAGAGADLTLGANDTINFAAGVNVANLLGATPTVLSAAPGGISGDTITTGGTWYLDGSQPAAAYHVIWAKATDNTIYFGAPYLTNAQGVVTQQINPGVGDALIDNNIVVYGGTGSQTLFGSGAAADYGVANQFWGGTAGDNLLVGAQTIVGGGAGDTLIAGPYTQSIRAAAGNESLIMGSGNETVDLASGNQTVDFGTGSGTIFGSGGTYSFVDLNQVTAGTTLNLSGFVSGPDKIDLFSTTDLANTGATASVSAQTHSGGNTYVTLSDNVTIAFVGVGSVSATDFVTNVGTVQVGKVV